MNTPRALRLIGEHSRQVADRWVEPASAEAASAERTMMDASTSLVMAAASLHSDLGIPLAVAIQEIADAAKKAATS